MNIRNIDQEKYIEIAEANLRKALEIFTNQQKAQIRFLQENGLDQEEAEDAVACLTEQMWINDFS